MKLTANITLDELTKSQVAERKGINNNPNPQQIENLKALAVNILQPVRSHFDKPLIISSGFRCAQLCTEIGSSCLLYTSPSPRDRQKSRMASWA